VSKTVPTTYPTIALGNQTIGQTVDSEDYRQVIRAQHFLWSRTGARVPGIVYNPSLRTTETAYSFTNDSGRDLDTWSGTATLRRVVDDSGTDSILLRVVIFARDVDAELTIHKNDGTETTIEVAGGSTYDYYETTASLPASTWSGEEVAMSFKVRVDDGGTAEFGNLLMFYAHEAVADSTYLPDGL
jgi:hypothetical protein